MVYKTFQRSSNLFLLFTNRGGSSFYPLSCSRSRLWRRLWLLLQNMRIPGWNGTAAEIARRKKISPPEIRTASHELAPLSTVCDLCCKKSNKIIWLLTCSTVQYIRASYMKIWIRLRPFFLLMTNMRWRCLYWSPPRPQSPGSPLCSP